MARYVKKAPGEPRKKRLVPYPAKMCFNVSSDLPARLNLVAAREGMSPSNLIRFALENYVRFSEVTFDIGGKGAPFDCELERKAPTPILWESQPYTPKVSIKNHLPPNKVSIKNHLPPGWDVQPYTPKVQGDLFD